jgi:hypothetical protein
MGIKTDTFMLISEVNLSYRQHPIKRLQEIQKCTR